jgi:secreted trypsin-like serine protease
LSGIELNFMPDFTNIIFFLQQVSGWGATNWQGTMPAELRKGNVSIVPRHICNSSESYGSTIVDGMVCANGFNENGIVDVCQGDSGGPLICENQLVGLASFGSRCGFLINLPGVFADVYYFSDWIKENWSSGRKLSFSQALIIIGFFISITNFKLHDISLC